MTTVNDLYHLIIKIDPVARESLNGDSEEHVVLEAVRRYLSEQRDKLGKIDPRRFYVYLDFKCRDRPAVNLWRIATAMARDYAMDYDKAVYVIKKWAIVRGVILNG